MAYIKENKVKIEMREIKNKERGFGPHLDFELDRIESWSWKAEPKASRFPQQKPLLEPQLEAKQLSGLCWKDNFTAENQP